MDDLQKKKEANFICSLLNTMKIGFGLNFCNPERDFTTHTEGNYFAVFHMNFDVFRRGRIDVADGFGNLCYYFLNCIFNSF